MARWYRELTPYTIVPGVATGATSSVPWGKGTKTVGWPCIMARPVRVAIHHQEVAGVVMARPEGTWPSCKYLLNDPQSLKKVAGVVMARPKGTWPSCKYLLMFVDGNI